MSDKNIVVRQPFIFFFKGMKNKCPTQQHRKKPVRYTRSCWWGAQRLQVVSNNNMYLPHFGLPPFDVQPSHLTFQKQQHRKKPVRYTRSCWWGTGFRQYQNNNNICTYLITKICDNDHATRCRNWSGACRAWAVLTVLFASVACGSCAWSYLPPSPGSTYANLMANLCANDGSLATSPGEPQAK